MFSAGDVSDYSNLTAGQYEGQVLKRERNYTWRPYWCVLRGRQLTFYEDSAKVHVAGRIEIQPGSRCDKGKGKGRFPSLAELFHRDYRRMKRYPLKLKTKKGTHLFTYEDVMEQSRWLMAMNNASQENASGVRLSWIPTPFSTFSIPMVASNPTLLADTVSPDPAGPSQSLNESGSRDSVTLQTAKVSAVGNILPVRSKSKSKRGEDTRTLIAESDSEMSDGLAFSNAILQHGNAHEVVTSL